MGLNSDGLVSDSLLVPWCHSLQEYHRCIRLHLPVSGIGILISQKYICCELALRDLNSCQQNFRLCQS